MPLTEANLDTHKCDHCGGTVREHCTESGGAWFLRPCDRHLAALTPLWKEMAMEDGITCRFCCQLLRSHFATGMSPINIRMGNATAVINLPDAKPGQVVILPLQEFIDCRKQDRPPETVPSPTSPPVTVER